MFVEMKWRTTACLYEGRKTYLEFCRKSTTYETVQKTDSYNYKDLVKQ